MYPISDVFKMYLLNPTRQFDARVIIGTTEYTGESIVSFDIDSSLVAGDEFTIGTVIPAKLTLQIKTSDDIPTNAKIVPQIKMTGGLVWNFITLGWDQINVPWDSDSTEILPLGEFYIDNRVLNNNVWTLTCYDKLITTEQAYTSNLVYPATMGSMFDEICTQLGLTKDSSIVIPAYSVATKPIGYTIREMLSYISSASGASVTINRDGKISFVKFNGTPESVSASDYFLLENTNPLKTITKIVAIYNKDGEYLEAGTGTEKATMTIYNPLITQTILNDLLTAYNGFAYQPFKMEWKGMPHLDAGDRLEITQLDNTVITVPMFTQKLMFNGGLKATSYSRSKSEQSSEFGYTGSVTKDVDTLNKTTVKQKTPYYGVQITKEAGITIESTNNSSAVFNSDEISMKINGVNKLYFNPATGKFEFDGTIYAKNIDVTGGKITASMIKTDELIVGDNITMGENATIVWDNVTGDKPTQYTDTMALDAIESTYINAQGIWTIGVYAQNINTTLAKIQSAQIESIEATKISAGTISGVTIETVSGNNTKVKINQQNIECIYDTSTAIKIGYFGSGAFPYIDFANSSGTAKMYKTSDTLVISADGIGGSPSINLANDSDSIVITANLLTLPSSTSIAGSQVATQAWVEANFQPKI